MDDPPHSLPGLLLAATLVCARQVDRSSALSDLPDGWNGHAHLSCQNLKLTQLSVQVLQRVAHPRCFVSIRQPAQVRWVARLFDHSDQCPDDRLQIVGHRNPSPIPDKPRPFVAYKVLDLTQDVLEIHGWECAEFKQQLLPFVRSDED